MTQPLFASSSLPLPCGFPSTAPAPRFQMGDRVCWQPLPHQDFGTIIGLQSAPAAHRQAWCWQYIILLDPNSPSHAWVQTDLAWEEDLISLVPPLAVAASEENPR